MKKGKAYPDDLTNQEWKLIEFLTENKKTKRGRKPKYGKREMLNAIFYLLRTGCSWRHLPHDFPPWKTVYTQLRTWKQGDFFQKANHHLRGELRKKSYFFKKSKSGDFGTGSNYQRYVGSQVRGHWS